MILARLARVINGVGFHRMIQGPLRPFHLITVEDTGVKCDFVKGVEKELLQQSAYNIKFFNTRTNCVNSQKPLLDKLGRKWHTKDIWDSLPMVYYARRLKG